MAEFARVAFVTSALICLPVGALADTLADLGRSVAFLVSTPGAPQSDVGTGFLVMHEDAPLLVTAEHVARAISADSLLVIQSVEGTGLPIPVSKLLANPDEQPPWRYHKEADLAVLRMEPAEELLPELQRRFLPSKMIRSEESAPGRPITLTLLGFPLALGVSGEFSPISRETKPGSGLLLYPRADTKKPALLFITQDPSVGGFSGAPVFDLGLPYASDRAAIHLRRREVEIVGVVHGTLSDDTGGKFGAVTPAHLLLEIIE